jgi:hypothetical protein
MDLRTKFGAVLGAGGLLMLAVSSVFAGPPTYFIEVTKTASPANVPPSGGTVVYTVWVESTGTGFFQVVNVNDGMTGCTLGAPTGDDGDADLESGETWAYSCTVAGVLPETENTATVNACHNTGGSCNQSAHDASGSADVTVGEGEEPPITDPPVTDPPVTDPPVTDPPITDPPVTDPPITDPPVTDPPVTDPPITDPPVTDPPVTDPPVTDPPVDPADSAGPTFDGEEQGTGAEPTEPATDGEAVTGGTDRSSNAIMLVIALGMLLASVVLVTPARPVRQR